MSSVENRSSNAQSATDAGTWCARLEMKALRATLMSIVLIAARKAERLSQEEETEHAKLVVLRTDLSLQMAGPCASLAFSLCPSSSMDLESCQKPFHLCVLSCCAGLDASMAD